MPLISKRSLPPNLEIKLFELFFESLAGLSSKADIEKFLFSLISPVEKTMLAKRLGIAILLAKGYSYEEIKTILKVSQETVSKVNMIVNYKGEGYKMVVKKAIEKENFKELFDGLIKEGLSVFSYSSYRKSPGIDPPKKSNKTPLG